MFPFWNEFIAPVLEAAGARRLVEIGALRGENTRQIIERLGPETELHVIDPVPDFDPSVHEAQFAGQYVFHRQLSVDVLGSLPPMDAALIDGDHNWYTVANELRLLTEVARSADAPLPVMVLHDVLWPYGRRDLYYDPETIPAEFRQPWDTRGILPGQSELSTRGTGLNPTMCNAVHEGGPRNGVMTALEDWMSSHDRPLRLVLLPVYYGLAIVVEQERLARQPALAAELDRIEGPEGREALARLGEEMRLRAMVFQHNAYYPGRDRDRRLVRRYLDTVKDALLDVHHLENEARLAHLFTRHRDGRPVDAKALRDPARHDQEVYRRLQRSRLGASGPVDRSFVPFTDMGRRRLDHLERSLNSLRTGKVAGDLVECGTGRGGGAIFMRAWMDAHDITDRVVWVADEFRAAPKKRKSPELPATGAAGFHADLNLVRDGFDRFGLLDDRVRFLQGKLGASLRDAAMGPVALIRIGPGLGEDAGAALDRLYDRLSPGGVVVVEDDPDSAARAAIDDLRARRGITGVVEQVDAGAVWWRKPEHEPTDQAQPAPRSDEPRIPLAPGLPAEPVDLTVVVVFYNMRREAERTLHSLSRGYQEGLEGTSYEVVVIDNGSAPEERLTEDFVARFGPEFRLVPRTRPTPRR